MLNSAFALATLLPAVVQSWVNGVGEAPTRPSAAPITPDDPSTLTLALIGTGTIAVYFMMRRSRWLRRDVPRFTGRLSGQSVAERDVDNLEERASRGAA